MSERISTDIAVIGAGISGLTTAHFLAGSGHQVRLVERQEQAGGSIRTSRFDRFMMEHGPNSVLDTTPVLHQLVADLGMEQELIYAGDSAKNRYIVRGSRLHALPTSPPAFFASRLFTTRAKLRLLREPFIRRSAPETEETLAAFVERRLGREFLDYAIDAFVAGVYAGIPEELSVRSAFPRLHALEQEYGSLIKGAILGARKRRKQRETSKQSARLFSFKSGLQALTDALAAEAGDSLHISTELRQVRRQQGGFCLDLRTDERDWQLTTRALVLTIDAHAYEQVDFDFAIPAGVGQLYYPPVTVVFSGYSAYLGRQPLDGFGFLIPRVEGRQTLGTLWNSTLFPDRAPAGGAASTSFVGGSRQPDNALLPDEKILELVRGDLRDLLGVEEEPDLVEIQRWTRAIPQYRPGHSELVEALESCERQHPGLYISGNFRGGISVADCIKQAHALSQRLRDEMEASNH